jgi:hypothetical protein
LALLFLKSGMSLQENIVVQLAKFNDVEKSRSNAIWSNHCKEPITINQGDQVFVSKSYIDTRNLSSSAIVILEDTPLELEFYFYWINDGNPGSVSSGLNLPTDTTNPWWFFNNSGSDYNPPKYTVRPRVIQGNTFQHTHRRPQVES